VSQGWAALWICATRGCTARAASAATMQASKACACQGESARIAASTDSHHDYTGRGERTTGADSGDALSTWMWRMARRVLRATNRGTGQPQAYRAAVARLAVHIIAEMRCQGMNRSDSGDDRRC
jgi:hypothetical protein